MDRLRIANKVIVANAYETLRNKLLKKYKHLLEDAKEYKDGEIKGFVFHHLNFRTDNMLPTLNYKGDKDAQTKYLKRLLEYFDLTSEQDKEDFIREVFKRYDVEEFALELEADKNLLDNEMKDVVFIPNRFHGYLHSSKGRRFPYAKDSRELYDQFLEYRDELRAEHYLKLIDNSGDSVFKKLDAVSRITDFLLYNKRKKDVLDMLDGALEVAEEIFSKMQ